MKRVIVLLLVSICALGVTPFAAFAHEGGVLIVKVKDERGVALVDKFSDDFELLFESTYRLKVVDLEAVLADLRSSKHMEFVEPERMVGAVLSATDPLFVNSTTDFEKQWYFSKIQLQRAWDRSTGGGTIIAIVDTGIDGKHEDLNDGRVIGGYASFCQATNPAKENDCLVRSSGELAAGVNSDDNGHGTIVAGIVGAIANNSKGIAGVVWNVHLMPIKALDSAGSGLASDVAVGIRWATDHGAKIINLSIGGAGLQGISVLQDAVSYAYNKGVLVVAAAGNDAAETGGDLNHDPVLPVCADGGKNMIVGVAAVDANDKKATFSNYGSNCIDISAPGTATFLNKADKLGLVSTYYDPSRPGEQDLYVYAAGTSVAAPIVSGVAALMMNVFPDLDINSLRDRLIGSVDNFDSVNQSGCNAGSCVGQIGKGRINALRAVTLSNTFAAGALIKDAAGTVYLIERGSRRPISQYVYEQRFKGTVVVNATADQLAEYPLGQSVAPVDSSLIKEPNNPTVYLVEGGVRRALSYLAFVSRGFQFSNIAVLAATELNSYSLGNDALVLNGVLMKTPDSPAVFILNNGRRQLLSYFVFLQRNFSSISIALISESELTAYQPQEQGYLYPPLEGSIIRGDAVATVYLVENGKTRGLSLQAFQNRSFRFEDVKVLPQSEMNGYEQGTDIIF